MPIFGTAADDAIVPGFTSAGVTGGPVNDAGVRVFAGEGNDTVTGGNGADTIDGGAGNDLLDGGGGDDVFVWGSGFDTMSGGAGLDTADYSLAPDRLRIYLIIPSLNNYAASGDRLSGIETIIGSAFGDSIIGDVGTQWLHGGAGDDLLDGWDGDDWLHGEAGADTLSGGGGRDYLSGGDGNDSLSGNGGDDTLIGGAGSDMLAGGDGNDSYTIDDATDRVVETVETIGPVTDTAFVTVSGWQADINIEVIRLYGAAMSVSGSETAEAIVANAAGGSTLSGGAGDDTLWGSALADTLRGDAGSDIIRGQGGADTMEGGAGDDQFVVLDAATVVIELAAGGTDTAWVAVDGWMMGANIEIGRLSGAATRLGGSAGDEQLVANAGLGSMLDGNGGDDVLWGSGFADMLRGGDGRDTFRGQGGADVYVGGLGDDAFVVLDALTAIIENAGEGYDTAWVGLAANTAFTLADNVERGNLSGLANRLTGNAADNVLVGDAVASRLDGGAGNDTLYGSAFGDTLIGGAGNDDIYTYGGADRIIYAGAGWGADRVVGFAQGSARLDFTGSGIGFGQLFLAAANGDTLILLPGGPGSTDSGSIKVFGAVLTQADFIFG